jgi:pyridoxal phosphate enzyme (YggS family)
MSVQVDTGLATRVERVREQIAHAAKSVGRAPEEVTIVAVSKTVGGDEVDTAVALGLRHFGENRVQDARLKFIDPLPAGCFLHMIGHLQSNKARLAVALFDEIESVDRVSLIDALEHEAERRETPLAVLLQVNIAREPQKAGCAPEEATALMRRLADSPWLEPRGLMTMAPLVDDAELVRPIFAGLRALRDALRRQHPSLALETLSMGMSNDFMVAISEGATAVRIGRAIFGE